MGLANCKPAPTSSGAGPVKQKSDDDAGLDTQECRLYRGLVGSLQSLSIDRCDMQFETSACAKGDEATDESFMDTTVLLARYLAGTHSTKVLLMKPEADHDPHEVFY